MYFALGCKDKDVTDIVRAQKMALAQGDLQQPIYRCLAFEPAATKIDSTLPFWEEGTGLPSMPCPSSRVAPPPFEYLDMSSSLGDAR